MAHTNTDIRDTAIALAKQAGELIQSMRSDLSVSYKSNIELVTQADVAADRMITDALHSMFPTHHIISEELAPDAAMSDQPTWIIDPIDGTVNYAHQHNQVAVSIAFYDQGKPQFGVVYNPFLNELFYAQCGQGAYLNDQPIQVSNTTSLRRAIIATGFPYDKDTIPTLTKRLGNVLEVCADVRRLGSAALDICWVACGRMDGYYESVKLWDFAAARIIAQEAGATCGHFSPSDTRAHWRGDDLIIATPALYDDLHALLANTTA